MVLWAQYVIKLNNEHFADIVSKDFHKSYRNSIPVQKTDQTDPAQKPANCLIRMYAKHFHTSQLTDIFSIQLKTYQTESVKHWGLILLNIKLRMRFSGASLPRKYIIRRNLKSDFSVKTMRRAEMIFFELGVVKSFKQKF